MTASITAIGVILPSFYFRRERSVTPLAIYHCSIKIISRGKGKSVVAAAAYRAGENIYSEYDGRINDYTRKGGVIHKEIMLPENAPTEYKDRAVLWNAVEKIEKAKNSQLAREIEIDLPIELNHMQNLNLVREYVKKNFTDKGMCADICIHDKNGENPHAHILLTMRPFSEDKAWGAKQKKEYLLNENGKKIYNPKKRQYKCKSIPTTDWNEHTKAEEWREAWANILNEHLEKANHAERVNHKSFERQGITDQIPTVHLGVAAHQMEKRGIKTDRGNINREIAVTNNLLRQLEARMNKIQKWLDEELQIDELPTLAAVITEILNRKNNTGEETRSQNIKNLKTASEIVNFLTENNITDFAGLEAKLKSMHNKQSEIRKELIPKERRLNVLDKHIEQSEYYREFSSINKLYKQQKPKDKTDFYESHRRELTLYQASERYLKDALNGRDKIPLPEWKAEHTKLTNEKKQLTAEYLSLKEEVGKVEKIARSVQDILHEEQRREQLIENRLQRVERKLINIR